MWGYPSLRFGQDSVFPTAQISLENNLTARLTVAVFLKDGHVSIEQQQLTEYFEIDSRRSDVKLVVPDTPAWWQGGYKISIGQE
ncbi:hypothetical protein VTP01DRAFT_3940 [Rhizomucor pusillus]|uniref:uncharacterized protein n=1 Tax=Rhizomucor pusillus TaxID=4840 RepID=UPI0037449471